MAAVEEFKLLDGTSIPWLGFGSGTGQAMSDFKDAAGKLALEAGIKHIDTAQAYGDDHQEVLLQLARFRLATDVS